MQLWAFLKTFDKIKGANAFHNNDEEKLPWKYKKIPNNSLNYLDT